MWNKRIGNKRFIIILAVVAIISVISVLAAGLTAASGFIRGSAEEKATPPLIRLHVLANSDSRRDQELKLLVRDRIIQTLGGRLEDSVSLEESRQVVQASLDELEEIAAQTLREAGCQDKVQACYGDFAFPTRYYGQFSLPAGTYEALRVVIGEGGGANWWCVLFPPLCFVGAHAQSMDGAVLDPQILAKQQPSSVKIKPALKIVELLLK